MPPKLCPDQCGCRSWRPQTCSLHTWAAGLPRASPQTSGKGSPRGREGSLVPVSFFLCGPLSQVTSPPLSGCPVSVAHSSGQVVWDWGWPLGSCRLPQPGFHILPRASERTATGGHECRAWTELERQRRLWQGPSWKPWQTGACMCWLARAHFGVCVGDTGLLRDWHGSREGSSLVEARPGTHSFVQIPAPLPAVSTVSSPVTWEYLCGGRVLRFPRANLPAV